MALVNFRPDKGIIVCIRGGLVQDIEGIPANVQVTVLDFDVNGLDDENLAEVNGEACNVSTWI